MRRAISVLLLVLAVGGIALCQEAPAAKEKAAPAPAQEGIVDNLFGELGIGMMMPAGEDKTPLAFGAVNYGFPILAGAGLGGQVGTKLTARNNDPDWLLSAGLFQRGIDIGATNAAWAVQGNYTRTWEQADLFSVKPTFGVDLDKTNYLALSGLWGLNEKRVDGPTQHIVTQAMLLWGSCWTPELATEIGAGYQFDDVDRLQAGVHAGYMLNKIMSINGTLTLNTEGDYFAGLSLGFDLGANGRNATFNNIMVTGGNDFTPFPMGSLPVAFYQTESNLAHAPAPLPPT